jgi:hypothetical protein
MPIACWIIKVTGNTLGLCNTDCLATTTTVARMRLDIVYTYISCCVISHFVLQASPLLSYFIQLPQRNQMEATIVNLIIQLTPSFRHCFSILKNPYNLFYFLSYSLDLGFASPCIIVHSNESIN